MVLKKLSIAALVSLIALSACSKKDKDEPQLPVGQIYNQAMDEMEKKNYEKAVEHFERLDREYPYSQWAVKAQIMAAYAYYKKQKYDDAILALDHFVQLHPGNANAPYAYYLKALCYYERIADVRRDQEMTDNAKKALQEVVARFPDSEYGRDARLKLDLVEDHLAGKEIEIGRYYLQKGNILAAINRYKRVIENYETTSHTPEALARLTEAYLALGVLSEAQRYAAVLGHNYPASKWYKYSYSLLKENVPPTIAQEEKAQSKETFVEKTLEKIGISKKKK